MTEEIIINGVNVAECEHLYGDNCCDDTKLSSVDCAKNNCRYKEYKHLQRENKEKIGIIEQMIKILYPNASDDELYDVTFNGEYIDKLKELKDTADTMLMANDIKKQDIDSLREANTRLEQENEKLKKEVKQIGSDFIKKGDYARELEQENRELKELNKKICEDWSKEIKVYWNALEEIKHGILHIPPFDKQSAQIIEALLKLINEVLK